MRRFSVGAAVLIVLACSCSSEPAAPVQNATARSLKIEILNFNESFGIGPGVSLQLTPALEDSLGNAMTMPPGLTLVSRDTSIATIDNSTYVLRTIAPGGTRVVASVMVNGRLVSDSISFGVVCTLELIVGLEPPVDTISVGASVSPKLTVVGCGGYHHYESLFRWHAADTTIVSVDSLSGRTTGLRAGQTVVTPTSDQFNLNLSMRVTVRPAP